MLEFLYNLFRRPRLSPQTLLSKALADYSDLDRRSIANIQTLDVKLRANVCDFVRAAKWIAKKYGCELKVISGHRSCEEQNSLYAQGRTKRGKIVTNARGGQSNHNFGLAIDLGLFKNGQYVDETNEELAYTIYHQLGGICAQYDLVWGGNWKMQDTPHFQWSGIPASPTSAMRESYKSNGSVMV